MEQRNGRIDRKLQPQPRVFCHYFIYRQRPEDRVIAALVRKSERIREELGSMNSVLDMRIVKTMQRGHPPRRRRRHGTRDPRDRP